MRRLLPAACLASCLATAACSSGPTPDELYTRGMAAAKRKAWPEAVSDLEAFVAKACRPPQRGRRCKDAHLALGQAYQDQGRLAQAWVELDAAEAGADRQRVQEELAAKQAAAVGRGPVIVRYRDEVTDLYTPRSVVVSVDFNDVFTKDKNAAELRGEWAQVFATSLPAGEHVLTVQAVHGCNPTAEKARCARSDVRRSWAFENQAKTPLMIEISAVIEPGQGDDAPEHPAFEYRLH